jgi:hypothetical protein
MDKISDAIKCTNCRNVLDSPVSLPCGCAICQKHTQNLTSSSIPCCSCEIEHPLPPNGAAFPPNKPLAKILETQIRGLNLGQEHTDAKQACSRLDELLDEIEHVLADPFNFTYEAIEHLKSVAQLKADEMKLKVDKDLALLIAKLDEYKTNSKSNLKSNEYLAKSGEFERKKENTRQQLKKFMATLNELTANELEWKRIKEESEKAIKSFENQLNKFKHDSLLQKCYGAHQVEVEKFIGKFEIDPRFKFR